MHDLKISQASKFDRFYPIVPANTRSDPIRQVAEAFVKNVDRVFALGYLPNLVFQSAAIAKRDAKEHEVEAAIGVMLSAEREVDRLANVNHKTLRNGFESLLFAIITGAWTAFETLAGDLWVEALLLHPNSLGLVAFPSTPLPARGGLEKWAMRMRSLDSILKAYRHSFGKSIQPTLSTINFENLSVLEGARNVLVHKAGIIDQRFLDRVVTHPQAYQRFDLHILNRGGEIPIDGETVAVLASAVVRASSSLLSFVDCWSPPNPPTA